MDVGIDPADGETLVLEAEVCGTGEAGETEHVEAEV